MKYSFVCIALFIAQCVLGQGEKSTVKQAATSVNFSKKSIATEIDALFQQAYPRNSPGAAILVAQGDKILYRKAFGLANLEWKVPVNTETVFHLASITKQFTSVAILMLMEQGKVSLKDPLSKYIADYPRGDEITLHHLLNHSSGIKSYTNLPEFRLKTRLDMTPEEIMDVFKHLPLEFNPGEKYAYSNSGYLLLGYIIEKLSGMSYGDFIQKNIFDKLGMKNSSYADSYKIIPNSANGYQLYEGNYEHAEYISPTIPYAAGSLMSTIDDMLLWHRAIHQNLLISADSKHLAFTNHTLSNGQHSNYGYGWYINEIAGVSSIEHTGGINGFTTSGIYIPEKNIYSIVLSNLDNGKGPEAMNIKLVAAFLGKPITEPIAVNLTEAQKKKWVGAYQFEDVVRFISYEDGTLYSTREGGRPMPLKPLSDHEYQFENSLATYHFYTKDGKKQVRYTDRIIKSIGIETDKKPIAEKQAILLPVATLMKYVGVYELQPSFQITIELQKDHLVAIAMGQPAVELHAEAENTFFIKGIGAQIVFHLNSDGTIKSLDFSQGGNKMEGKKIK